MFNFWMGVACSNCIVNELFDCLFSDANYFLQALDKQYNCKAS